MKYQLVFSDGREPIRNLNIEQLTDYISNNPNELGNFKPFKQGKDGDAIPIPKEKDRATSTRETGKTTGKNKKELAEERELFEKGLNLGQRNLISTGYREIKYVGGAFGLVKTGKGGDEPIFSSVVLQKEQKILNLKSVVKEAVSQNMSNICMTAKLLNMEIFEEDISEFLTNAINKFNP